MWLEVEVGPGLFVPPEDNSYSVDFAMEAINKAYPGCTGMYLDRAGHMLAVYGRKGSTRAGLIQDVAIEASRAVSKLPTWMGYTARWRVKWVGIAEANKRDQEARTPALPRMASLYESVHQSLS